VNVHGGIVLPNIPSSPKKAVILYMTLIEKLETRSSALTVEEFSEMYNTSNKTIYKLIKAGKLPATRIGGIRIDPAEAAEWLRKRSTKQ
jgi:excisionase family DNA binding protein